MNSTVIVAVLGLLTTLAAAGFTSYMQRQSQRESRVFEARVVGYGELVSALYDYERATYSRVKARLEGRADVDRESLRQEAWSSNAKARAAIGVVALLSGRADLHTRFDAVRRSVGDLNQATNVSDLRAQYDSINVELADVIVQAKADVTRP